jgi:hypothetical protein
VGANEGREAEIEVTPEILRAGLDALDGFYIGDGIYAPISEALSAAFLAMSKVLAESHGLSRKIDAPNSETLQA